MGDSNIVVTGGGIGILIVAALVIILTGPAIQQGFDADISGWAFLFIAIFILLLLLGIGGYIKLKV